MATRILALSIFMATVLALSGQLGFTAEEKDAIIGTRGGEAFYEPLSTLQRFTTGFVEVDNLSATGMLRIGSETGTSEPPSYPSPGKGLIVRRILSTDYSDGNIVAMTDELQLQRDGTFAGFKIVNSSVSGNRSIACMGIDSSGVNKNRVLLMDPGATLNLYQNSDNVVYLNCSFGNTYTPTHQTQISIQRIGGDMFWIGFLISTYNQ